MMPLDTAEVSTPATMRNPASGNGMHSILTAQP
jgi:hypothetical protein